MNPTSITMMRTTSSLTMKGGRWPHCCRWCHRSFPSYFDPHILLLLSCMVLWPIVWINLGCIVIQVSVSSDWCQYGESKVCNNTENVMMREDRGYIVCQAFVIFRKMKACVLRQPVICIQVEDDYALTKTWVSYGPMDSPTWRRQPQASASLPVPCCLCLVS